MKNAIYHSLNLLFFHKECQDLILLLLFSFLPKPIGFICKVLCFCQINTVFDLCIKFSVKPDFIELSSRCDSEREDIIIIKQLYTVIVWYLFLFAVTLRLRL